MKNFTNNLKLVALAMFGVVFGVSSGCSSSSQDGASGGSPSVQLTGAVIDGPVASGIVWIDANNNGELDIDERERSARTDIDGYFSKSKDGVDYCNDNDSDNDIYCLRGSANPGDTVTVRVTQGYDVFTGEPFHGTLSFKAKVNDDGTIEEFKVTPITALLTHHNDEQIKTFSDAEIETFSDNLGVEEANLYKDFTDFEEDIESADRKALFKAALKIQKFLEPIIGQLADAYDSEPEAMYKRAFGELAKQLKKSPVNLNLDNLEMMEAQAILDVVEKPLKESSGKQPRNIDSDLALNAAKIVDAIDTAIGVGTTTTTTTDLKKFERVIQVAADILSENKLDDSGQATFEQADFDQAIMLASDSVYQGKLEVDSVDLKDVKDRIVKAEVTSTNIATTTLLDYDARPCLGDNFGPEGACDTERSLQGKKLKLTASRDSGDEATLYFLKDDTSTGENSIVVCATHDGNNFDLKNDKFEGSWKRINDYSAVSSIFIGEADSTFSFIVSSVNYLNDESEEPESDFTKVTRWRFRLDFGGELTDYDAKKKGSVFLEDIGSTDTGDENIAPNALTEASIVCPAGQTKLP